MCCSRIGSAAFLIILHLGMWGGVMWLCERHRINVGFILEADPRTDLHYHEVLQVMHWWWRCSGATAANGWVPLASQIAGLFLVLWLGSLTLYLFAWTRGDTAWFEGAGYVHLAPVLFTLLVLFCPFNILKRYVMRLFVW